MHGMSAQVCRLDADGMCTAGLRMARHSGCYHVEFEVLQVTDGDGAYVGLVKSDVNKSSYPGSDEKGIGWRAKGGVRHQHNTMDLSSSGSGDGGGGTVPSWGQGDRVGFIFDTETLQLRFVKAPPTPPALPTPRRRPNPLPSPTPSPRVTSQNGRMLGTTCTVPMDDALYFAVGRYYGMCTFRAVFIHQQRGGDPPMDFSALERLCTFMTAPDHSLSELILSSNQARPRSRRDRAEIAPRSRRDRAEVAPAQSGHARAVGRLGCITPQRRAPPSRFICHLSSTADGPLEVPHECAHRGRAAPAPRRLRPRHVSTDAPRREWQRHDA